jgi:NADH-quinone oxidoreductase subunit J
MLEQFFFFFFLICAFLLVTTKNPIHSILFLILVFLNTSLFLFLLNIEFLSIIFIIIYVGAIAVLFLFIIMMIDLKISNKINNYLKYFSIGGFLGFFFFYEFFFFISNDNNLLNLSNNLQFLQLYNNWVIKIDNLNNLKCIGQFLYTYYSVHFVLAGFLLLLGIIGPILLTFNTNIFSKNQFIYKQLSVSHNKNNNIIKLN